MRLRGQILFLLIHVFFYLNSSKNEISYSKMSQTNLSKINFNINPYLKLAVGFNICNLLLVLDKSDVIMI